jgi:uncharacterized protein
MELEQSFEMPFSEDAVWAAFADVPMLVKCMPGASLQNDPRTVGDNTELSILFTVKLGPIVGSFLGDGTVSKNDANRMGSFSGSGSDRKSGSRVKGEASFAIKSLEQNKTRVDIQVAYSLTGALAQFSRGAIVKELASALTRDFSANLQSEISLRMQATANPKLASNSDPHPTSVPTPGALDAGNLFWRMLWRSLRNRIGGWFQRADP